MKLSSSPRLSPSPRAPRWIRVAALCLPLLTLGACGACNAEFTFEDDVGDPETPGMNMPYGVGASATIRVGRPGLLGSSVEDWTATSSDESVFVVESTDLDSEANRYEVFVYGVGEGTADLLIWADATLETQYSQQVIRVVRPDAVRLAAAEHFWAGATAETNVPVIDTEVRVVRAEQVTLLTDVTLEGEPVYGRGMVTALDDDIALSVQVESTTYGRARDWIRLQRDSAGTSAVEIQLSGVRDRDIDVIAVSPDDVVVVGMDPAPTSGAAEGDSLAVVCTGKDVSDRRVYGMPCRWRFDDTLLDDESGTVLTYRFAPGEGVPVAAHLDDDRISDTLSIEGNEPAVRDANKIGCDATGAGPAAPLFVLLAGLVGLRRRRGRR